MNIDDSEFEKAVSTAGQCLMPILSPLPPYKPVLNSMMTSSAFNKIVSELKYGWTQI